jgi:glutamate-1-semialdehyde 2,1-aminomutase
MLCLFFTAEPVIDESSAKRADVASFATYFHSMLESGVYLAPSQFEAGFVSLAHSDDDIAHTITAARTAVAAVAAVATRAK